MLEVFKALSDRCRLRLIAILLRGEFTVQELTAIIETGQSRISHHLKILTAAGLLNVKRQGTWSYYRIEETNSFFSSIRPFFEQELVYLAERSADLAAVEAVFDERRRRNLVFFDRHAGQLDELVQTFLPMPEYRNQLLTLVPLGTRVLEIGVGTGALLMELDKVCSKVIGVDHSQAMLDEARCRLSKVGRNGVELRLGEMAHLPGADSSIDCVIANMVIHHAADPLTALKEIRRVLVQDGLLLIADLVRHEHESAREKLADQWLGFEERELAGWIKAADFHHVSCKLIRGGIGQETVMIFSAR